LTPNDLAARHDAVRGSGEQLYRWYSHVVCRGVTAPSRAHERRHSGAKSAVERVWRRRRKCRALTCSRRGAVTYLCSTRTTTVTGAGSRARGGAWGYTLLSPAATLGAPIWRTAAGRWRGGRREVSRGQVAQLVEQRTENPRVGGSIPSLATPTTRLTRARASRANTRSYSCCPQ
jgi:hypothetical protein